MINHAESYPQQRQIYEAGFPANTKGVFEILYNGTWHRAVIVDSYDPEAAGLCWQLINGGGTIQPEFVSSHRKAANNNHSSHTTE